VNLTSILEQINDACLVLDSDGKVLFANEPAARLVGRSLQELMGKSLPDETDSGLPLAQIARSSAQTGHSSTAQHVATKLQARFEVRAIPTSNALLLFCFESTQDDDLQHCLTQLKETERELESVSYVVSHDLRAPLRHIEAFAGLLEQNLAAKADASSTEYLGIIGQSARQMSQLLDGVLSYSRLCRRDVNRTNVSLDAAFKAVLQELKLEMEGRNIVLHVGPMPEVEGDPWMIRELLLQLFRNALKFTRAKTEARIEVTATTVAGEVWMRVKDNGIGFDNQYADRLFGLFQRLHSDPRFEGKGVGLAHVRRMAQRQGGRVWAEGKPNEGASFYVALPKAGA
jgi:light-regulated signal transduction histidine kinase (bacteriophytochrome)